MSILSEAEKLAAVTDAVTAQYAKELARVLRDLERQLAVLAVDALAGSKTAMQRAVRAQKLRDQIKTALRLAGYPELTQKAAGSALDALVAQVERLQGAAQIAAFTSNDFTRILALKELAKLNLYGQGDALAFAVWRTFQHGLFSQRPLNDLLEDLATTLDIELYEARTFYDTTASVFTRQVESLKSEDDDVFAFVGPVDKKIRPFCYQHAGRVYTRAEINALDNGQLPNVFLTAGGYNCRHVWQAVSKVSELQALVGTDQRIPEVAEALTRFSKGDRKAA
jgi:hypothetical protein